MERNTNSKKAIRVKKSISVDELFYSNEELKKMGVSIHEERSNDTNDILIRDVDELRKVLFNEEVLSTNNDDITSMEDIFKDSSNSSKVSKSFMDKVNKEHKTTTNTRKNDNNSRLTSKVSSILEGSFNISSIQSKIIPDFRSMKIDKILNDVDNYYRRYKDSIDIEKQLSVSLCKTLKKLLPSFDPYTVVAQHSYLLHRFKCLYRDHPEYEILQILIKY